MAQYIGPAALPFLPQPTRATEVTNVTTMPTAPTTTTRFSPRPGETGNAQFTGVPSGVPQAATVEATIYLPIPEKQAKRSGFVAACTAVAVRAGQLAFRYRLELAPTALVATLTGLGWWQHLTGPVGGPTFGFTVLAGVGATVAGYAGLHHKHNALLTGGAGVAVAAGDVAAAVGAGPGAVSMTVSAIGAGLAYAAWTPWLIRHREDRKELAPAPGDGKAPVTNGPTAAMTGATAQGTIPVTSFTAATVREEDFAAEAAAIRAANSPFHRAVIPYADDDSDDITVPLRLGWDELGEPVLLKMLYRHTLVAGASDWGKSGIINLIIKKLLRKKHVELYGIDLKPGAPEIGPWAPLFKRIARTPEEVRDLLDSLEVEAKRRGEANADRGLASYAEGGGPVRKWIPGDPTAPKGSPEHGHGPAIFVVTDELGELIRQDEALRKLEAELRKQDPESYPVEQDIATRYESRLALDRFLAIQYISATQQPSSRVFGGNTDARGNYGNRICTRAGEAGHAQLVFGQGCRANGFVPEKLTRPGEFYLGAPEMPLTDPPRCRAEYVTDLDIAADVAHLHGGFQPKVPVGRFAPQGEKRPLIRMVKAPQQTFPDGASVGRDDWPDLYRVFCNLCEQQGYATKEDLTKNGPFDSRDTARRALEAWLEHGVQVRKAGRAEQFYLPDTTDLDD